MSQPGTGLRRFHQCSIVTPSSIAPDCLQGVAKAMTGSTNTAVLVAAFCAPKHQHNPPFSYWRASFEKPTTALLAINKSSLNQFC